MESWSTCSWRRVWLAIFGSCEHGGDDDAHVRHHYNHVCVDATQEQGIRGRNVKLRKSLQLKKYYKTKVDNRRWTYYYYTCHHVFVRAPESNVARHTCELKTYCGTYTQVQGPVQTTMSTRVCMVRACSRINRVPVAMIACVTPSSLQLLSRMHIAASCERRHCRRSAPRAPRGLILQHQTTQNKYIRTVVEVIRRSMTNNKSCVQRAMWQAKTCM